MGCVDPPISKSQPLKKAEIHSRLWLHPVHPSAFKTAVVCGVFAPASLGFFMRFCARQCRPHGRSIAEISPVL